MINRKEVSMELNKLICTINLWNHVGMQQGVINRPKITYYIASWMNNWKFMKYPILAIHNF